MFIFLVIERGLVATVAFFKTVLGDASVSLHSSSIKSRDVSSVANTLSYIRLGVDTQPYHGSCKLVVRLVADLKFCGSVWRSKHRPVANMEMPSFL